MSKVCVLTSVHSPFDVRIFHKQAKSLAKAGYEVVLIAPHSRNEVVDGIKIRALPPWRGRVKRILSTWRVLWWALQERADIYHFHDPELLPVGVLSRLLTRKPVVYDAHEYYPDAMLFRPWVPRGLRRLVSKLVDCGELFLGQFVSAIVVADDGIEARFKGMPKVVKLYNFPLKSIFLRERSSSGERRGVVYVGHIDEDRGIWVMLECMKILAGEYGSKVRLKVLGKRPENGLSLRIDSWLRKNQMEKNVQFAGYVPHGRLPEEMQGALIGLLALNPRRFQRDIPTKMFEYMACGLAIVATASPTTSRFVEGVDCGFLIDSTEPEPYAKAISYLLGHPEEAGQMGERGRRAFLGRYNWEKTEEGKLLQLYADLAARSG